MLQDLIEKFGNQQTVAKMLEISQGQISKRLRLLNLLPPLQKRLLNGELRPSTAYALSKLPDHVQKEYVNKERIFLKEVEAKRRKLTISKELEDLLETPIENPTVKRIKVTLTLTIHDTLTYQRIMTVLKGFPNVCVEEKRQS
jgi:ParB-like chromosome segregation protein Spo0J